jgi:hypothetical protein
MLLCFDLLGISTEAYFTVTDLFKLFIFDINKLGLILTEIKVSICQECGLVLLRVGASNELVRIPLYKFRVFIRILLNHVFLLKLLLDSPKLYTPLLSSFHKQLLSIRERVVQVKKIILRQAEAISGTFYTRFVALTST